MAIASPRYFCIGCKWKGDEPRKKNYFKLCPRCALVVKEIVIRPTLRELGKATCFHTRCKTVIDAEQVRYNHKFCLDCGATLNIHLRSKQGWKGGSLDFTPLSS